MQKIIFIVEKTETGYSAYVDNLEDDFVATTGSNMAELKANMVEAYNLLQEDKNAVLITEQDLYIKFDLPQFFDYYKPVINAKGLAKRVGINDTLLNQYVKGTKKPSEKQTQKILSGIQALGRELLDFA
jgi:predicted RNase H-like HicB family nuclease